MVSKGGVALRGLTTFLRAVEFLGSILVLGITSYWLGVLTHRHNHLPTWMKAVEGMSGGAVIYTAFAVILTCFLGGFTFFAFLAVLLDVLFTGAFIAIAILTRGGTRSCPARNAPSVLGRNNRTSCRLETAVFAVAIAMAVFFLVSAVLQVLLSRHHKKEKRYGPGPSNNYTSGSGAKQPFWKRGRRPKTTYEAQEMGTPGYSDLGATNGTSAANKKQPFWKRNKNSSPATHDAELGAAGASAYIAEEKYRHNNARASHETGVTGTTAASPTAAYGGSSGNYQNGVAEMTAPTTAYQPYHQGAATGGYSQPATTAEYPSTFGHGNYQTA